MEIIDEIIKSLDLPVLDSVSHPQGTQRWKPPKEGWIMINSDGPVCSVRRPGGGGVAACDHAWILLGLMC